MRIGVGLDGALGLHHDVLRDLAVDARALGFESVWTNAGATGFDAFHVCARWHGVSGLATGISVVPVANWTAPTLAMQAATVSQVTEGTFILGIGSNPLIGPVRATFGIPEVSALAGLREYLVVLRQLLAGERVTFEGRLVNLRGIALAFRPPATPVYVAALGPKTLRLGGELADGVLPNWASPEQMAWCREQIAEGAGKAGRDPASIPVVQYVRVCVDEDVPAARTALARQVVQYALFPAYRAHFERMGFTDALDAVERARAAGADEAKVLADFPDELIRRVGYFGPPAGAAKEFTRLAAGCDTAVVRVITTRPDAEKVRVAMRALTPQAIAAA